MAAPHVSDSISTDSGAPYQGRLRIEIDQISQDLGAFTSEVRVRGILENKNDWSTDNQTPNVERHIGNYAEYNPSPFNFNIRAHDELIYIAHTFTVPHDDDGTKTVTFHVHYGQTGTPTFQFDKQVAATITLTPMAVGGWIRMTSPVGGGGAKITVWTHGVPYVRTGGRWKKAVPYVRTGGVWKPCK